MTDTSEPTDDEKKRPKTLLRSGEDDGPYDKDFDGANDEALVIRLAILEEEHRDLDAAITSLEQNSPYERLTIARLKKKKLQLKDEIGEVKDAMLPDIIA
ncbi:DUF465 domain-containing protein [Hyphococcus formosus]|uniref:YdcH family protein n=1 Tax=Hyphococcus formosus TaxID=3143534 RepID=UPI00398A57D5